SELLLSVATFSHSAPVDSALLASTVRAELDASPGCERRVIRYTVVGQRAVADTNDYEIRSIGGPPEDSALRFRSLVALRPRSPLPERCRGVLVTPSLDPHDAAEIRYPL